MIEKNTPVIFLHIPKTAGLTLHEILTDQYPHRKHKIIYTVAHTKTYTGLSEEKKRKIGVIKGHVLYGLHEQMPMKPVYLTFLRDPVARTISGYEFIKSKKDHPFHKEMLQNDFSLFDFLDRKLVANFDNMQVRFLCGNNAMPFGQVNETHLELAKRNLIDQHTLFGITEMFDESILYFKHELGWHQPFYAKVNVTKNTSIYRNDLDDKTNQAVIAVNKFDLQLYAFAKKIFTDKIQSFGHDFMNELNEFRQENAKLQTKLSRRNYWRSFYTKFTQG